MSWGKTRKERKNLACLHAGYWALALQHIILCEDRNILCVVPVAWPCKGHFFSGRDLNSRWAVSVDIITPLWKI